VTDAISRHPSTDDEPGLTIGIDLGTTYSLVAVLQDGQPLVLDNALGETLTPSAVSIGDDGQLLVGAAARARAVTRPASTATLFKRDMGTEGTVTLEGSSEAFTPQQLSALVLRQLKEDAEAALGQRVAEAVITVPAYFGELQRKATKDAGAIAGLKVERIINEPTAAAMAYGLHERDRELQAVVLDLGGGTFDVTVLEIIDGIIEIQASAGDARLGGEDFSQVLAHWAADEVQRAHGVILSRESDDKAWARLVAAGDRAKVALTEAQESLIAVPRLALPDGREVDISLPLSRQDAEERWSELLERARRAMMRAVRDAGLKASDIDEVLLVGGATRMPCLGQLATTVFGRLPLRHLPPDEAVAIGAAVQAALKAGDAAVDDLIVTDIAPFSMGIATSTETGGYRVSGLFTPVLERGTVIPASRVKRFSTVTDFQRAIKIEVYQGERSMCRDNTLLGQFEVTALPSAPAGEQSVDVRFTYDLNGLLEVDATVVGTERTTSLLIEGAPGRLSQRQIDKARDAMKMLKFHPRDALPNATALERAEALYVELTGGERERLGAMLAAFRGALELQQRDLIDKQRSLLNQVVAALKRR